MFTVSSQVWGSSLYQTTKSDAGGVDVAAMALSPLQAASDSAYAFFYKTFPILAGSAVGVQGAGRSGPIQARGNFQSFDIKKGRVENQARCVGCLFRRKNNTVNVRNKFYRL